MKKLLFGFIGLSLITLTGATTASASLYTNEYNENTYTNSASSPAFAIASDEIFDSATLSITLKGRTIGSNSLFTWYYGSVIDIYAGGSTLVDNQVLNGTTQTFQFDLDEATISSMMATDSLTYSIIGQWADWYRDDGTWGNSKSNFYLDKVELNTVSSPTAPVPVPAAAWLLGSGLLGLVGLGRKKA